MTQPTRTPIPHADGLSTARARYLEAAYDAIRRQLLPEAPAREQVALAFSFPTKGTASGHGGGVIGQCIYKGLEGSASGECMMIVVHPSQWAEDVAVLAVLAHEMAHAATPGAGHGRPFVELVRRIGLDGKPTATVPGEAFKQAVEAMRPTLPAFPAGSLTIVGRKVAGTRMRLFECACRIKVRAARDELPWVCDECGEQPQLKQGSKAPRESK
jgi:hypothetical protein